MADTAEAISGVPAEGNESIFTGTEAGVAAHETPNPQIDNILSQLGTVTQSNEQLKSVLANIIQHLSTSGVPPKEEEVLSPEEQELANIKKALAQTVQAVTTDYQERTTKEQQAKVEYEQAMQVQLQAQVNGACEQLDTQLSEEGYPGFQQYRTMVKEMIMNDPDWSSDPAIFQQQLKMANDPRFWAKLYKEKVVPKLQAFNKSFGYMANQRVPEGMNRTWNDEDYMNLTQPRSTQEEY